MYCINLPARAEQSFAFRCVFLPLMGVRGEAPGSASGLETVAAALFPASRSPAVPLTAGSLASQTLQQPNSDKTTWLLSTLPRQRRRGRERPRTDKHSPLGLDSLPPLLLSVIVVFLWSRPLPSTRTQTLASSFLLTDNLFHPSFAHIPHLFFLFGCRRSR